MAKHAKTDEIPAADIPGEAETHAHAEVKGSRKSAALQKAEALRAVIADKANLLALLRSDPMTPAEHEERVYETHARPRGREKRQIARRLGRRLTLALFLLIVALPTLLATIYTLAVASPQYTSEFQLAVRGWDAPAMDSVGAVLGAGASGAGGLVLANSYIVAEFLRSRDAVEAITPRVDPIAVYSAPSVDWFARYRGERRYEEFLPFWRRHVKVNFDPLTGIILGLVEAPSPDTARSIATELRVEAEKLINRLSEKAREDTLGQARKEVTTAEEKLRSARMELETYRNQSQIVDPRKQAETQLLSLKEMRDDRAKARAELEAAGSLMSKTAPTLLALQARLKALDAQIKIAEDNLASTNASVASLATVLSKFQELEIQQGVAERAYTNALEAMDRARRDADRKQIYVAAFVEPRLPDAPSFPSPFKNVAIVLAICMGLWIVASVFGHALLDRARGA